MRRWDGSSGLRCPTLCLAGRASPGGSRRWVAQKTEVAVDIPTSVKGMACWLSFHVVEPGGEVRESYVELVHAVRSGLGEHEFDVYVWDDHEGMWVMAPEDEEV